MANERIAVYIKQLRLSKALLERQLAGLNENDLLLQPPIRGNCANWIMGHIIATRFTALEYMGQGLWDDDAYALYKVGSSPITDVSSPHLSYEELKAAYETTHNTLVTCLEETNDDALDTLVDENATLADKLNFVVWHEAYHTGQFEYLRQLTGINDSIP